MNTQKVKDSADCSGCQAAGTTKDHSTHRSGIEHPFRSNQLGATQTTSMRHQIEDTMKGTQASAKHETEEQRRLLGSQVKPTQPDDKFCGKKC